MAKHIVNLRREKDTKRTVRFIEDVAPDQVPVIGMLYVQKWALGILGNPKSLKVTVETDA